MRPILLFASLLIASGCASPSTTDPDVQVRVQWLTSPAALPDPIRQIRVLVHYEDETEEIINEVGGPNIRDFDGDGSEELVRSDLRTLEPLTIDLIAQSEDGTPVFVGRAGPMTLAVGERRHVDIALYPIDAIIGTVLSGAPVTGFLHTATALPDGRVLIAGGFNATSPATCPSALSGPGTHCFEAVATEDAWLFDPATARFETVRSGLLVPRGGHTATLLPDSRVLIAGGAARAILAFTPQVAGGPAGFSPTLVPQAADGSPGGHASFEVFDPNLNIEAVDSDRNGDPARGGFAGGNGSTSQPGLLNQPRFLHAAAALAGDADVVLLAGGAGGDGAEGTYEIYDDRRAGGYGVYPNAGATLQVPRAWPGAVGLRPRGTDEVWIFGGNVPAGHDDLAEIWSRTGVTDHVGSTRPATDTEFPKTSATDMILHPEYALIGPQVVALQNATHALVTGWLGPRCRTDGTGPLFPAGAEETVLCPHEVRGAPQVRSFTVDASTGITLPTMTTSEAHHALGQATVIDGGQVLVTGGLASIIWNGQPAIDVFTGTVVGGQAMRGPAGFRMSAPRLLHGAAPLPNGGILVTGGAGVASDATRVTPLDTAEFFFVPGER